MVAGWRETDLKLAHENPVRPTTKRAKPIVDPNEKRGMADKNCRAISILVGCVCVYVCNVFR